MLYTPVNDRIKNETFSKFANKHIVDIPIQFWPRVEVPHEYAKEAQLGIKAILYLLYCPCKRFKTLESIARGKFRDDIPICCDKTAGHEEAKFRRGINDHHVAMATK